MQKAEFLDIMQQLAGGTLAPEDWLQWWDDNNRDLTSFCSAGEKLRLKPVCREESASRATSISQQEACKILEKNGIEFSSSTRYHDKWLEELDAFEQVSDESLYRAILSEMQADFPKLAKFISSNLDLLDELQEGASDREIQDVEQLLGVVLPNDLRRFFRITSAISMEGLRISLSGLFDHPGIHNTGNGCYICIGDYWLEGDGDQVLMDLYNSNTEVLYYAHESSPPSLRSLAPDFYSFIERLPEAEV